jgi:adenylate cyclase
MNCKDTKNKKSPAEYYVKKDFFTFEALSNLLINFQYKKSGMPQEIERKFLVNGEFKKFATKQTRIKQGYLSSVPGRSVRIRINGQKGFITIKGAANKTGLSRYEWEKEIAVTEAVELLEICEPGVIEKIRYYIPYGDFTFEVDEFYGENEGLIVAEIEMKSESDNFERPDWLGNEVTGDRRYFNSMLVKNPFSTWKENLKDP